MAVLRRVRVYEEVLTKDQWEFMVPCSCGKLKKIENNWKNCPFCGEKITVAEAVIESVPSAEKAAAMEGK